MLLTKRCVKKKKKEEKKPMANLLAYVFFFHNASFVCENTPEKEKGNLELYERWGLKNYHCLI